VYEHPYFLLLNGDGISERWYMITGTLAYDNAWITDNWSEKAKRRKTTGSGRTAHLRDVHRRFKNGFQVGTPKGARGPENH
jgi:hypothetical protein